MSDTKIYLKLVIFALLMSFFNALVCLSAEECTKFKSRTEENLAISRDLQDEWYSSAKAGGVISRKEKSPSEKTRVRKEAKLAREARLVEKAKDNDKVRYIKDVKPADNNNFTEIVNVTKETKTAVSKVVFKLDAPEFIPGQSSLFVDNKPSFPDELILSNGSVNWSYKIIQKNQKYYISYHNYLTIHNLYPILVGSYEESIKSEKLWKFMNMNLDYIQWNAYALNQGFGNIVDATLHLIHYKIKYPKINGSNQKECIIMTINDCAHYPLTLHCSLKNDNFYPNKDRLLELKSPESVSLSVLDKYFPSIYPEEDCNCTGESVEKTHWQNMYKAISEEVTIQPEGGSTIKSVIVKTFMGSTILHVNPREGKFLNLILDVPTEQMVKENNLIFTKKLSSLIHSDSGISEAIYPLIFDKNKLERIRSINIYVIMNQTFAMVQYDSQYLRMVYPLDCVVDSRL